MTEDEIQEEQSLPFYETPKDLYELYMLIRAETSRGQSFYQYYLKLVFLVDVGKEMLSDEYKDLREEAERFLSNSKSYPERRQLERDGDGYRMGPGTSSTGFINIHGNDLSIALQEVKDQQATTLIPTIKRLDSRIFKALIDSGIIDIKKPSMEDMLMQDVMYNIQRRVAESA